MTFPRILFFWSVLAVSVLPVKAGTLTYMSGTTDTASYETTAGDPLTLFIEGGAAEQSGSLFGGGGVTKTGPGALSLTGSNSYAGGTVLNEGTLRVDNSYALGTGLVTINGGTYGNTGGDVGLDNPFTVTNDFAIDVQGGIGSVLDFFSNVAMGTNHTITFTGDGIACFEGGVSGSGITFLSDGSPAHVTFCSDVDNTFTGTLRIGAGVTLELWKQGNDGDPQVIAVSGNLLIDAGATAELIIKEQFAAGSDLEVNGTLQGDASSETNTVDVLTGSGTITGDEGVTLAVNSGTFNGTITEHQAIRKQGGGTLAITGSNSYTGGTAVISGTLRAQDAHALGNGDVAVTDGGTLWVDAGVALDPGTGKKVTLENDGLSAYRKDFAQDEDLASFGTIASNSTEAQILGGTASAAGSVTASFDDEPTSPASNDEFRVSDVLTLDGISGETFVMQLSYTQDAYDAAVVAGLYTSETQLLIGTLDGGVWIPVGTGPFVDGAWSGELALGAYGVDTLNNVVWVVTDHGGEFSVVPEPASVVLLGLGLFTLAVRRRVS